MRRRTLIIIALSLFCETGYCQNPWMVNSVDEIYGKSIFITKLDTELSNEFRSSCLLKIGDKYKKFSKQKQLSNTIIDAQTYQTSTPFTIKKESYVCLGNANITLYVPTKTIEHLLPTYILSTSVIDSLFNSYKQNYEYVNYSKLKNTDRLNLGSGIIKNNIILNRYLPIKWIRHTYLHKETPFMADICVFSDTSHITYNYIYNLVQRGILVSKEIVNEEIRKDEEQKLAIRLELEREDSITASKDFYAVVKQAHTVYEENGSIHDAFEVGDTLSLFAYNDKEKCFVAFHRFTPVLLKSKYPLYSKTYKQWFNENYSTKSKETEYLLRMCTNANGQRREKARVADSLIQYRALLRIERALDSLHHIIDSTKQVYKKKQIFITNQDYVFAEYGGRFGLTWSFFNCFNKEIKYIELIVRPYNQVDDIQRDDIGRTEAKARCIGPIERGEHATFSFDNLFWDDNDIIKYVRLTYIKITFKDNSTKVYSGWENIKNRMLKYNH